MSRRNRDPQCPEWPGQRATPEQERKASTAQWSYNAYIEPFLDIAQGLEQSIAPIKLGFKDGEKEGGALGVDDDLAVVGPRGAARSWHCNSRQLVEVLQVPSHKCFLTIFLLRINLGLRGQPEEQQWPSQFSLK